MTTSRVIPIADFRRAVVSPPSLEYSPMPQGSATDALGRELRDLRISVTDRCNFRCVYCMPKRVFDKNYSFLPHTSLLTFDEITRVARLFVERGVRKIRLTGGEPLLRKDIERLIAMLSALRTQDGDQLDLTLTTNGSLLEKKAQSLKDAGLKRVTVSLDSLDEETFRRMADVNFSVSEVLRGIDAAHRVGLGPIKINMMVKGGMNDHEIVSMARHFKNTPYILRFIEYMDVGTSNSWKMEEMIPSSEVVRRISAEMALEKIAPSTSGETAARWRYTDGDGEIGVISSVTQAFCHSCTRARLSTEGKIFTCLFADAGYDIRALLRSGRADDDISAFIASLWRKRTERHSALRSGSTMAVPALGKRVEMSYIGG